MSPSTPALRPSRLAPIAWAASSITGRPCASLISGIGAGIPNRSTATIAFVFGVRAARTVSAVTLRVSMSTSQNTGVAPMLAIASQVA